MTTLKVATWSVPYSDKRYCLYDPLEHSFLSDGKHIRTYTTKSAARGALSRVNHGQLPDKRK